jgi:hypothetical protein
MSGKQTLLTILVFIFVTITVIYPSIQILNIQASDASIIPAYKDFAVTLPTRNIGPGAPLVLYPGGCGVVELVENTNVINASIYKYESRQAGIETHPLQIRKLGDSTIEICTTTNTKPGLYDLVLETGGSGKLVVPRSIWVLGELPETIRILAMSDLHFGTGPRSVYEGDVNRVSAFMLANALKPDLILWSGDIQEIDDETTARIAQVYRYLFLYNYPVLSVPGNHDYPAKSYTRYIGPTRWVRVIGDKLLVIGVYTVPYRSESEVITWDEIVFLEEALSNYSHIPYKIIVTHYPMFYYQGELATRYDDEEVLKPYTQETPDTPVSGYWSGNMTAFRYVLKLVEDYNVTIVLSGHIHRDQFVKYTSTRTNTTTYFITITTTAHGTAMYQGILVFELNTKTGELSFPVKPSTFIGFKNNTGKIAYNTIPVSLYQSKLIKTNTTYYLTISNRAEWLPSEFTTTLALPGTINLGSFIEKKTHGNSSIDVNSVYYDGKWSYTEISVYVAVNSRIELLISLFKDEKPPEVKLSYKGTPYLNKTFTLYVDISDDVSGIDPLNVKFTYNGSAIDASVFTPATITSDLNRVIYTLKLTMKASEKTTTLLTIEAVDNTGKSITKKYLVVFYPSGASPSEEPVIELVETPSTTTITTILETTTTTTSPTTTTTYTPTTTTITTPQNTTTPASTTTTSEQSTTTTPMTTEQKGEFNTLIMAIAVILVVIAVGLYAFIKHR